MTKIAAAQQKQTLMKIRLAGSEPLSHPLHRHRVPTAHNLRIRRSEPLHNYASSAAQGQLHDQCNPTEMKVCDIIKIDKRY